MPLLGQLVQLSELAGRYSGTFTEESYKILRIGIIKLLCNLCYSHIRFQ